MSVQTDPLPPIPQLVAPLISQVPGQWQLRDLRFEASWLQWFVQLRAKVDVINASLVSFGGLASGAGFTAQDANGTFVLRTITGTAGRVIVTNGDGTAGNPTIDISNNVAFINAANTFSAGQTFSTTVNFNGEAIFNSRPRYAVSVVLDAVDDAAAAALGVPVGGTYRTASVLKIRVT